MNWKTHLNSKAEEAYRATKNLVDKIDADKLDWRPESGDNWMSMAQLLEHIKVACGTVMNCFLTNDWAPVMPEGAGEDTMMPTAEHLPSCGSVEEFKAAFAADEELTMRLINEATGDDLDNKTLVAPWNPIERTQGTQFQECLDHLNSHKAQLFYYLKLQGKPVNTGDLWGLEMD